MPRENISMAFRVCVGLALGFAALSAASGAAEAISSKVKAACQGDYFRHCSAHSPGSAGVRQCMRNVGAGLSTPCLVALVEEGQISKTDIDRYQASVGGGEKPAANVNKADAEKSVPVVKKSEKVKTDTKQKAQKSAKSEKTSKAASSGKTAKKPSKVADKGKSGKKADKKEKKNTKTAKSEKGTKSSKSSKTADKGKSGKSAGDKKDAKTAKSGKSEKGTKSSKTADKSNAGKKNSGKKDPKVASAEKSSGKVKSASSAKP